MNILYLLEILETKKVSELVEAIDLPPIDINLIIWSAIENGEIEINESKDEIVALKPATPSCDESLAEKLLAVVKHYAKEEFNVTRGTLNKTIKDPTTGKGYLWHEYLMAYRWLVDTGAIEEGIVSVPQTKKHPYHKFVFLGLPGNPNEEWNAREINKWIARFDSNKVK